MKPRVKRETDFASHPDLRQIESDLKSIPSPIVFFIGAGLSRPLGFPLWGELLNSLIDYGHSLGRMTQDQVEEARQLIISNRLLECGQRLRDTLRTRLNTRLSEIYTRPLPEECGVYEDLVNVPCAGYITTNYDIALESVFVKTHARPLNTFLPDDSLAFLINTSAAPFLLKLHGDVRRGTFVISSKDYETLVNNEALTRFLYHVFLNKRVVFLGYSLADETILQPLRLIVKDFHGLTHRHVALVPRSRVSTINVSEVEEQLGISFVSYDDDPDDAVGGLIAKWALHEEQSSRQSARYYGRSLRKYPALLIPVLRKAAEGVFHWLMSLSTKWGPTPTATSRAANVAEGLITLKFAAECLGKKFDSAVFIRELMTFREEDGGFVSITLGKPQIQTHSLSTYALALWDAQESDNAVVRAGCEWLLRNRAEDGYGWGRMSTHDKTRVVPSIWAFAALLLGNALDEESWTRFRNHLLSARKIDHVIAGSGESPTACGWLLWLLAQLKSKKLFSQGDALLSELAIDQLLSGDVSLECEKETYDVRLPSSREPVHISWTHSTASAVILGCLGWVNVKPMLWNVIGKGVDLLLRQCDPVDGHLRDPAIEREGAQGSYVHHSMYGLWALTKCIEVTALIEKEH